MQSYHVPGMTCSHCEQAILSAVGTLPGVISVDVSIERKLVSVDGEARPADVIAALDDAGFDAVDVGPLEEHRTG